MKELPRRLLIVIPEWEERTFYDLHEYVLGEFVAIPHDSYSFVESGEVTGFRIWNSWLGLYVQKVLKSVAKEEDWIRRLRSGVEPEVVRLDVPEDSEPSDLIDSTPEVHYAGRVDGSRAVSQKLEFFVTLDKNGSHRPHRELVFLEIDSLEYIILLILTSE